MISAIRADLYKLKHSRGLYFSLFIGFILCVSNLIITLFKQNQLFNDAKEHSQLLYIYYPITVANSALGINNRSYMTSLFFTIFPILAALPFGVSLFDEKKTGYINFCLTRTKSSVYYISKFIVAFIGGSIACGAILIFSIILNAAFIPSAPPEVISAMFPVAYEGTFFLDLYLQHPVLFMLLYTLIDMLFAGWFAVLSVFATFIFEYKITVLMFPFAFYLIVSFFSKSLGISLGILHSILPQYSLSNFNLGTILCELLVLNLVTVLMITLMIKKDNKC